MLIRYPMSGRLLKCERLSDSKQGFFIPFATFFENEPLLYRSVFLPKEPLIHAPIHGILTLADYAPVRFLICGRTRIALWIHTAQDRPLLPCRNELLALAAEGALLKEGQLLGRLELSALYRRGYEPLISLLTPFPIVTSHTRS